MVSTLYCNFSSPFFFTRPSNWLSASRFGGNFYNDMNNDVARFTTHVQTCLATTEVVAGCEKLLQKAESGFTFCNKICACCAFYRPKTNLFCSKWRNSRVWHDSRVTLSNLQQLDLLQDRFNPWPVKRATWFFHSFCSNVAKQVARFCYPFYHWR